MEILGANETDKAKMVSDTIEAYLEETYNETSHFFMLVGFQDGGKDKLHVVGNMHRDQIVEYLGALHNLSKLDDHDDTTAH